MKTIDDSKELVLKRIKFLQDKDNELGEKIESIRSKKISQSKILERNIEDFEIK